MDQEPGKRTNEEGQLDLGCKINYELRIMGFQSKLETLNQKQITQ